MITEPKWVTVETLLVLHSESISDFGGSEGLRDDGLLQSALERPRNLFAYGNDPSISELAAAYCYGIAQNHPFIDGNKRAAILAAAVFLDINGYEFLPEEPEVVHIVLALAAGEIDEATLAAWIEENIRPMPK